MGEQVNNLVLAAFEDELEKIGGFPKFPFVGRIAKSLSSEGGNMVELGNRLKNPWKGMKAGWEAMSPTKALRAGGKAVPGLEQEIAKQGPKAGVLRRTFGAGEHLLPGHTPDTSTLRGAAETASRAGWTGQGKITKYLPLGDKGQNALAMATAAPSMVGLARGEGEHAGENIGGALGGIGTSVLTAGTGMPGVAASIGSSLLAAGLGRKFDQARAERRAQLGNQVTYPPEYAEFMEPNR